MGGFALPPQIMQKLFQGQQNPLYPQQTPAPQGAPVDFGGQVLPNPDNIQPRADTDPGPATKLYGGAKLLTPTFSGPMGTDISNPAKNQLEPGMMQPASAQDAPQRGSIAQAMQGPPPPQRGAVAEAMQAHAPTTDPSTIHNPYQLPQHGKLAKIFLGIGEALGNPLATRIGEQDRQLQREHNEFEATGRTKTAADLNREAAQSFEAESQGKAALYNMGKDQETQKANAVSQIQQEVESGKYGTGDALLARWRRIAQANPHIGLTDEDIQGAIGSTKALGSNYTLTRDPQTQAPIELVDRQGNHYSESNLPKDPEAQQMWNDAKTASGQKETLTENKEKRVAQFAADAQARAFQQAQTMEGRKTAQPHLETINDATRQQEMMQQLMSGKMNPASQTAAMFKMIGLEQPTGTHRIMPAEIEGIEQMGGISDRLKQKLLNWKQGDRFSPDLVPDLLQTAKILTQNKLKTANDNLQSTFRNTGYKVPGSDANGRLDKPQDYQEQGGGKQQPQGATHTGIGSQDKKKHWLDAKGNDLGLAE